MNPHHLRTFLAVRRHLNYTRPSEAVLSHRAADRGSIRTGASTTPGFYLLPALLGPFPRRFPKVALHYTVENSLKIEKKIVRNEIDLGFVGAHLSSEDLELKPLMEDEIVCFAAPSHRLAKARHIAPGSLEEEMG